MTINTKRDQKELYVDSLEVMKYLSVSKSTLERLVADGMPHVKINRSRRYKLSEIDRWLNKRLSYNLKHE